MGWGGVGRWWIVGEQKEGSGHFTVVCLVTRPWIGSEAEGDLVFDTNLTAFP